MLRKIIRIDEEKCNGCGLCVVDCAEGALKILDGKARVVSESFCDGLGACIGACPQGALTIVEREAAAFDEEAVLKHVKGHKRHEAERREASPPEPLPCGCPSSLSRKLEPLRSAGPKEASTLPEPCAQASSQLGHWPIQLRLLPPGGALYENADLLLFADCTAAAHPNFHQRFVAGKTLIMTCPKLDDAEASVSKLSVILSQPIRSLTLVIMEVPCCSGLVRMTEAALSRAGKHLSFEIVKLGVNGEELNRVAMAL